MLRQLRKDAGKEREDAADWLEMSQQTISKIELGQQAIKAPHVRLLCQLYGVDADVVDTLLRLARDANQRGWWATYRGTLPEWARKLVGFEADAADLWNYEAEFVPGLLQTPAYMEAISRASLPAITDEEIASSVQLRRERQSRLDGEQPPRLHVYLNEAVVRRVVGGPEVMREQLYHLAEASKLDHVTIRVLPFSAGAHAAMTGSFVMMQFPDEPAPAFVYVDNERGAVYQEDPGDIDRYTLIMQLLDEVTLSDHDSRALLGQIAETLRSKHP
ncbi:helix-turn-helix domain-containing protein [Saccharopolyspora sp. NPDC002376]